MGPLADGQDRGVRLQGNAVGIQSAIQSRIQTPKMPSVWTADYIADLGSCSAVDFSLHRIVSS